MGRMLMLAMEEILGQSAMNAVLNLASLGHLINNYPPNNLDPGIRFEEVSRLQATLEAIYGPRAGLGLALRSGRACFKYSLREFGPLLGITDLAFRLLPLPEKLSLGLEKFAEAFNRFSDQRVRLEETPQHLFWHIERCPLCWGRHTPSPVCHLALGTLQEALFWISGGKHFYVEETLCIAKGDATCTMMIEKTPLE